MNHEAGRVEAFQRGRLLTECKVAVYMALYDRCAIASADRQELAPALQAHQAAGRTLERRDHVDELGTQAGNGVLQRIGINALVIHCDAHYLRTRRPEGA